MKNASLRAFTLAETVVVVALTAILSTAIASLIVYFYSANRYVLQETQAIGYARSSIVAAMQDLREANYGADGSYPIAIAATSTITFFANVDADVAFEQLHYYLSGTSLYRGTTNPAGTPPSYVGQPEVTSLVIQNVRNGTSTPVFRYYDSSGNELTPPVNIGAISSITITVMTDVDPLHAPLVYTLIGRATLRNLRNPTTE